VILVSAFVAVFLLANTDGRIEHAEAVQGCPAKPVVDISGLQVPKDVCIPDGFGELPIEYFDDFSWKSFIALVWPVQNGQRGIPDPAKTVSDPGPKVFETYKAQFEIFHNDGSVPAPWGVYDSVNPCRTAMQFGEVMLASFSKFADLGQAGFGDLVGPIVAQNRTYVRFSTGFDRIEFDQITQNTLYLRSELDKATNLTFQNGAIDIKSAWIEMAGVPNPDRYYKRTAIVMDPVTGDCSPKTVGLVGLHIVQKTPSRPQWIWSSFEQIDNVPGGPDTSGKFNLHDGTVTAMPISNPFPIDPLILPVPTPFNILRIKPIHASTQSTNAAYRAKLRAVNSVWQFYQLVVTQWPVPENSPANPGSPQFTFPGLGSDQTAFSNTSMETFDQKRISRSCMACHNSTRTKTDFLWALNDHAFPADVPGFLFKNEPLRQLQKLLSEDRPVLKAALPKHNPQKLKIDKQPQ